MCNYAPLGDRLERAGKSRGRRRHRRVDVAGIEWHQHRGADQQGLSWPRATGGAALWGTSGFPDGSTSTSSSSTRILTSTTRRHSTAMAYRVNAGLGDIRFYGPTLSSPLDPSTPPAKANMAKYGSGEWTRVLIDATQSWEFETSAGVGWPPLPGHQQDRSRPGIPNRCPLGRVRDRHPLPRRRAARAADDGSAEQAPAGRVVAGRRWSRTRDLVRFPRVG
ncbi:hypothetical protein MSIMFI_04363 [Mycobacterium simulans]|nr:hypothetical protein MSIMFI_04363 [Mycobacterium simulans]